MASVTSLDKDLRKLRLEKYTPAAAGEARQWIEDALGDKLCSPDLLQGLKDGVALCRLINLAVPPPGIKFKKSAMPFVQMENISQFLGACQAAPLNLHQHDTFLTVDLFEQKDPAQVLQCIGAFSRAAHALRPQVFPDPIGPRTAVTPQATGGGRTRTRGASVASDASSSSAQQQPGSAVSSWSRREKEASTTPAWNIAQYGYMGGASQGNLGISFGSRRQVTTAGPTVPTLADKVRMREKAAEEERAQQRQEEEGRRLADEEQSWEEETQRMRQQERRKAEEERRQWEEQERQWKAAEEQRRKEEAEAAARMEEERRQTKARSPAKLRGQFLSQYQAEQAAAAAAAATATDSEAEQEENRSRARELETELELARQREAEYERDRQDRPAKPGAVKARSRPQTPRSPKANNASQLNRHESWSQGGEILHTKWHTRHPDLPEETPSSSSSPSSPRPLPDPHAVPRPLPDPAKYASPPRTLIEREIETDRRRQAEWEAAQRQTALAAASMPPPTADQRWDVSQWSGYTGGDNQNKGSHGIGAGPRHVVGPRPLPNP